MSIKCRFIWRDCRHFLRLHYRNQNKKFSFLSSRNVTKTSYYCRSQPKAGGQLLCGQKYSTLFNGRSVCLTKCLSAQQVKSLGNYAPSTESGTRDPFTTVKSDLFTIHKEIQQTLRSSSTELENIAGYHFDGKGKSFRPMVVLLMSHACNLHTGLSNKGLYTGQRDIAMISEMIHTASLVHDDVIDAAETRRGRASIQKNWGQRKAILTGNYILSVSSMILAKIGNDEVVEVLSTVLEDLVRGEFMQLGSRENENERFSHYLKKTFKKTASLIANSCKAVSILGQCSGEIVDVAYHYGKNIGIAFQLVDDLLDFTSSEALMGKPTAADLKLGLATAPVLFAAQQYPELNELIMRRFENPGDVELAWKCVSKSDGVQQTRLLAEQHGKEATRLAMKLKPSIYRDALVGTIVKVLNRLN